MLRTVPLLFSTLLFFFPLFSTPSITITHHTSPHHTLCITQHNTTAAPRDCYAYYWSYALLCPRTATMGIDITQGIKLLVGQEIEETGHTTRRETTSTIETDADYRNVSIQQKHRISSQNCVYKLTYYLLAQEISETQTGFFLFAPADFKTWYKRALGRRP